MAFRVFPRRSPHLVAVFFSCLLIVLPENHLRGEEATDGTRMEGRRPRIGLALSGGGARGVAHIGVLKALEELQIPVDFIAGTSMGAIVGGLYASGMSPEEIERWFREVDWRYLLSDAPPRETRTFRSKEREYRLNQNLEVGLSRQGKVQLPAGFIAGQKLIITMRELTLPVRKIHDFDRLPIPFRAVATDLESGEKATLRGGDLAEVMRASMAVPGVFTPYRIGDQVLVDGGLASNLPIDAVRAMGADVVIAVDLRMDLKRESELESALAVTNQVLDILIQRETLAQVRQLTPRDVYIRLTLPGATSAGFTTSAGNIPLGYEETMKHADELRRLSVSRAAFQRFVEHHRIAREKSGISVTFLQVDTPSGPVRRSLEEQIDFAPGEQVEFWQLEKELLGMEGFRNQEVHDFEIVDHEGETGLLLRTRERSRGPNFINLGFDFSYSSSGETDANLLLSYRMTELNRLGAEWETFLSIGSSTRIQSEWYQPVDADRRFFLAASLLYSSEFITGLNAERERLRFRLRDAEVAFDLGMRLGSVGEARIGYAGGTSKVGRAIGLPSDIRTDAQRSELRAMLTLDTLDRTNFPSSGFFGSATVAASRRELGASDDFTRLNAQLFKPLTFGANTIVPRIAAGLALGGQELPLYDRFSLGGFLQLSGYSRSGLYDENTLVGELVYYREIMKLPPGFGGGLYAGFSVEAGTLWSSSGHAEFGDMIYGGSLFLGADTILGPLHLGVGAAEGGETAVYLQLAPLFRQDRTRR